MDPLAFTTNLLPSDNSVRGTEVLKNPGNVFDYTNGLIAELQSKGYTENTDLFTFPYDWRFGASGENVNKLKQKIQEIITQTGSQKVDVIAHSTGGLIVKKYVAQNDDHKIGKAIFVGVPNVGAPKALKVLLEGDNFGVIGLSDAEMKKIAANMPIAYELAPSLKYFLNKGSYFRIVTVKLLSTDIEDLDFNETNTLLTAVHHLNQLGIDRASGLHTFNFDNFDLRSKGVDQYNIAGCTQGTIGRIIERRTALISTNIDRHEIEYVPGDGTVPLESATNVPVDASKKYYSLEANHGQMMSQNGIRQLIASLLTNTPPTPDRNITQDISRCKLNGRAISIFSPVDIEVTDQLGRRAGKASDGSIENQIPNAQLEILGQEKFVYLPTEAGQVYTVKLTGAATGTFTLKNQSISDNVPGATEVFADIPTTTRLAGQLQLNGAQSTLALDTDGNGVIDQTLAPSAVVPAAAAEDMVPPQTTTAVSGIAGQPGYYRSPVSVSLSASDPPTGGPAAGVMKTEYQLDGGPVQAYRAPIRISAEGPHTLSYTSTDRAGNKEPKKALNFSIDTTPPEAMMQFNIHTRDLQFVGRDNLSSPEAIAVTDDDRITLTDQAGNTTQITLKEKERKRKLSAEIQSISYNGRAVNLSKNQLKFRWEFDSRGGLKFLSQKVKAKKEFQIQASFDGKKTVIEGRDRSGRISQTRPGLVLLKITTRNGDLDWTL